MYQLSYYQGDLLVESWMFPNLAICRWKIRNLRASTHKTGEFKIDMV